MESLGELGFWLAVGIVVAAWILADARKKRDRTHQKQETLRVLLTAEGQSTPEILAYLRESDAAEQKREEDERLSVNKAVRRMLAVLAAFVAGAVAFLVSVRAFHGADPQPQSLQAMIILIVPLSAGALFAFLTYVLIRGKKNVPPPGA